MRLSKIKFIQIPELSNYINLLKDTRDFITNKLYEAKTKLDRYEYAEYDDELFAVTKDELKQMVRVYEDDNERINYLIHIKKLEMKSLERDRNLILKKHKTNAIELSYRVNKKEIKRVIVKSNLLGKIVQKICYNLDQKKDRLYFILLFSDGTTLQRYISIDSIQRIVLDS